VEGELKITQRSILLALVNGVFASFATGVSADSNAIVNLTIQANRLEGRIPDRVYGQFLEHIYHSCNGGLWGELVWNRSFEDSKEKPKTKAVDNNPNVAPAETPLDESPFCAPFWKAVGKATGAVVTNQPFNSQQCLKLTTSGAGMGIQQDRFAVRQDETYRGSIWLRGQCEKGLECRLVAGERVLASQTLAAPSSDWAEVVLVLKPSESAKDGSLQILAKGEAECWLDQVSLMSDAARASGGFRPDLLEAGKALKPPLIRWPGGGYASAYRWKDGIGPQSKRVSQTRPMWGDTDVNSLGTDEFIDYCRRVGAQPLMVFNLGLWRRKPADDAVLLNEALEWIEYCNGSTNTPMGALRAVNGHSQPYNVQFWELANEWYWTGSSSALYIDRAAEFSAAIRKRYPDLLLTACGSNGYKMETTHEESMLARIGAQVQTVSLHRYERPGGYDKAPATWSGYLDAFVAAAGAAGHPAVQVYASEWNGHTVDWDNGLLAARLLLLFERRSDVVWGAAPALFYRHVSGVNYNNALINFDHTGWFPGANYVVMKLFREHYAADRLSITGVHSPVEAVATKSLDGKSICIKLVNPESHSVRVRISVSGMARVPEPGAVLIAPVNLQSKASLADPDAIRIVPVTLDREGDISVLEMPPWSVGVVDWCPRVKSHGHE
jgi:alpha-N-arabinofuranosidase